MVAAAPLSRYDDSRGLESPLSLSSVLSPFLLRFAEVSPVRHPRRRNIKRDAAADTACVHTTD